MASEPILVALDVAVDRSRSGPSVLSDYWVLTKPDVNFMIAITTLAAFCVGSPISRLHFP
jgi:heme O synthase-like polyprenyltransferase